MVGSQGAEEGEGSGLFGRGSGRECLVSGVGGLVTSRSTLPFLAASHGCPTVEAAVAGAGSDGDFAAVVAGGCVGLEFFHRGGEGGALRG